MKTFTLVTLGFCFTVFTSLNGQIDTLEEITSVTGNKVINICTPGGTKQISGSGTVIFRGKDGRWVSNIINDSVQNNSQEVKRLIVEFYGEPLISYRAKTMMLKSVQPTQQKTFTVFKKDLSDIALKLNTLKTSNGRSPVILKNFKNIFFGSSIYATGEMIKEIKKLPYVKNVRLAMEVKAIQDESTFLTGAPEIWNKYNDQGEGIVIVIIDTGIDYTHQALGGGIGESYKVIGGFDFVNNDSVPMDDNGHGTHVAGIAAANGDSIKGIAPKASLIAYKVLDKNGSGWSDDIIAAIEKCADPNDDGNFDDMPDIVNMSLGGKGSYDDPLSVAVNNACEAGMVFCIAAGNSGDEYSIGCPGSAANAITVGASDKNDVIAEFSSRGPNEGNYSIKPEILAPGVDIFSLAPHNKFAVHSGTSMATPHIAGVCALLKKIHPDWGYREMKSALVTTAKDLGISPYDQGGGRVQADKAVKVNIISEPPVLNYNRIPFGTDKFEKTDIISINNISDEKKKYTVLVDNTNEAVSIIPDVDSFTLDAGNSKQLSVKLNFSKNLIDPEDSLTYQFFGKIRLISDTDTISIPWGIIRQCVLTLSSNTLTDFQIYNRNTLISGNIIPENNQPGQFTIPIKPGIYKFLVHSFSNYFKSNITIYKDDTIDFDFKDLKNKVSVIPVDENNNPMNASGGLTNIFFRDQFITSSYNENTFNKYIKVSDLTNEDSVGFYGVYYTDYGNNAYMAQDLKSGINSDTILQNQASEFIRKEILVRYPKCNYFVFATYMEGTTLWGIDSKEFNLLNSNPRISLFLTKSKKNLDISASYAISPSDTFAITTEDFFSKPFRLVNDTVFNYYAADVEDIDYKRTAKDKYYSMDKYYSPPGQTYIINSGTDLYRPVYLFNTDNNNDFDIKGNVYFSFQRYKHMGEKLFFDAFNDISVNLSIYNSLNNIIYQGKSNFLDTTLVPGLYTFVITNEQQDYNNLNTKLRITNRFDLNKNAYPPLINSFHIKDTNNVPGNIFTSSNKLLVYFSISDETPYNKHISDSVRGEFKYTVLKFNSMNPDSVHLFYKPNSSADWIRLNSIVAGVDSLTGYNFKAELPDLGSSDNMKFDIEITSTDNDGNYSEYIYTECFLIRDVKKPVASDDSYICIAGKQFKTTKEKGVLSNDNANDNYFGISSYVLSTTKNGKLQLSANGSFRYSALKGFVGIDTFKYYIENFEGLRDTATVLLTITKPVSVKDEEQSSEDLFITYPNPVTSYSYVKFALKKDSKIDLSIYDINGNIVEQLYHGLLQKGDYSFKWNVNSGTEVAEGVYFYRLSSETGIITKKMIVMKK